MTRRRSRAREIIGDKRGKLDNHFAITNAAEQRAGRRRSATQHDGNKSRRDWSPPPWILDGNGINALSIGRRAKLGSRPATVVLAISNSATVHPFPLPRYLCVFLLIFFTFLIFFLPTPFFCSKYYSCRSATRDEGERNNFRWNVLSARLSVDRSRNMEWNAVQFRAVFRFLCSVFYVLRCD